MVPGLFMVTGRATSAPTSVVADHDIRAPSRPSVGARGRGRAAASRPPAATSSCQFRPPHPAGGQSNTGVATHGVADATFDGGLHDPAAFNLSQDPYDEDNDDVQEIEETGHGECRKLPNGPPENLAELQIMFQNIAMDGSSSCILGGHMSEGHEGDEDDLGDGSPVTIRKRTSSAATTATSPKKKTNHPMVKIMKRIWETMQASTAIAQKALQGDFLVESAQHCMRLAVESGAVEGTDEHFMACKLFVKPTHRAVFLTLTSKEARLGFLKRWCQEKGK
ncbi:uncharacterized protein C2845_PM06G10630 [Panicum miliaceum]|uniref:Uncharacterized protein n=1 Tax=Panicum miliaceum TaxID=4540 RepID=A0A3L6R6B0_PANMI|nr:uncharacterized protein C2845_PM06G10630 [Panicum miliaceum]